MNISIKMCLLVLMFSTTDWQTLQIRTYWVEFAGNCHTSTDIKFGLVHVMYATQKNKCGVDFSLKFRKAVAVCPFLFRER